MYKSKRNDFVTTEGDYRTLISARKTMNALISTITPKPEDASQPIFDSESPEYIRLVLRNGEQHWIVGLFGSFDPDCKWISAIASSPNNGVQYKIVIQCSEIASYEELPPEAVEIMPLEKQPFGFSNHPAAC